MDFDHNNLLVTEWVVITMRYYILMSGALTASENRTLRNN